MEPIPPDEPLPPDTEPSPLVDFMETQTSAIKELTTDMLMNKQLQRLVKFPAIDGGPPHYINPANVAGLSGVNMGGSPAVNCCAVLLVGVGPLVVGVSIERAAKALAWRIDEPPPAAEYKGPKLSLN